MQKIKRIKTSRRFALSICAIVIATGILSIVATDIEMKSHALMEAKQKARIVLDRNMATHTYFSQKLKPALFKKMAPFVNKNYFEPIWMSSTYAIRDIDKYYQKLSHSDYYYKEASINARSPENEADPFEREFIKNLNKTPDLIEKTEVKNIQGKPFYVVLRRGETMEQSCLRCHSTPDKAPIDLVNYYGTQRSFHRSEGETVSAISIRIPLSNAYEHINEIVFKLSVILILTLLIVAGFSIYLSQRWVFRPLADIRDKANSITRNPGLLGEKIEAPPSQELADLAGTLNTLSTKLRQEMDHLEFRVNERTKDLDATNKELEEEVQQHKETISRLKIALDEVKTLRGILPICSHCKRIRDDQGYWSQVEAYIQNHSEAEFTHSICKECAKKFYPDMNIYDDGNQD